LKFTDGADHLRPEASARAVAQSGSTASNGNVLTREASAQDVDLPAPRGPVDERDVTKVGGVGEAVREDRAWRAVRLVVTDIAILGDLADVSHEDGLGVGEDVLDGQVEAAVAGKQG